VFIDYPKHFGVFIDYPINFGIGDGIGNLLEHSHHHQDRFLVLSWHW
jgi:hypothetical protein